MKKALMLLQAGVMLWTFGSAPPGYAAASAANDQVAINGMSFEVYIRIMRGMSEGEVLAKAGPPDQIVEEGRTVTPNPAFVAPRESTHPETPRRGLPRAGSGVTIHDVKSFYYLPTQADPFVTRVIFQGGVVTNVERIRQF